MVGCENPKKSAPDGTTGVADLELKCKDTVELTSRRRSRLRKKRRAESLVPGGSSDLQEVGVAR